MKSTGAPVSRAWARNSGTQLAPAVAGDRFEMVLRDGDAVLGSAVAQFA